MDVSLFRDLDRLRRTGNFSQAAALVNLSQPAFSRRIQALEQWVGAILVDRSHQPVSLTDAGAQILEAGLQALSRIETERSQILEAQSLPDKYVVTFGAQHSIGWRFYPAWLQALEEAYGPILSRLRADDLPNCLEDLKSGDVDFVIAYQTEETDQSRVFDPVSIGEDILIPVCKPNSDGAPLFAFEATLAATGPSRTAAIDTSAIRMPFLRFGDAAPIGAHLEPLFLAKGLNAQLRVVYENSMAGALRIRALAGDGVAWLPQSLVANDLENRLLVHTGEADWAVRLDIRLFRNLERSNRVTRSIWSFLKVRQAVPLFSSDAFARSRS